MDQLIENKLNAVVGKALKGLAEAIGVPLALTDDEFGFYKPLNPRSASGPGATGADSPTNLRSE